MRLVKLKFKLFLNLTILLLLFSVFNVYAGQTCENYCGANSGDCYDDCKDRVDDCPCNCCCSNNLCSGPCSESCFLPGTEIRMADGTIKFIEDVSVGDFVLGYDLSLGKMVVSEVLELESPIREDYYFMLFEDGTELKVTREHPLYVRKDKVEGWASVYPEATMWDAQMDVMKIELGDKVLKSTGDWVELVYMEYHLEQVQTYNLKSVSGPSTFFAEGILVHNKGDNPPPPPPPICGDGQWQASTDKACEYTTNPDTFKDNGEYTGTVCQVNGQECRSSCTCCGDSVKQSAEPCDLGPNNGVDLNNDGYIGAGECRVACTFCGDGTKQAGEYCDDGNGVNEGNGNVNQCRNDCTLCGDGILQNTHGETCDYESDTVPTCRDKTAGADACTFCGDGVFQPDKEFCDPAILCPSKACDWSNYDEWKDSGYYPDCRADCTACGDGKLQVGYGETCDDTREFSDQQHSAFGSQDYANTCPGGCVQPAFISGNEEKACKCIGELCDTYDNNANCRHCAGNVNTHPYYELLCWSDTGSLWQLNIDKNEDGVLCSCCVYGEAGCCDDPNDQSCLGANRVAGESICDDGVDEGFSWVYQTRNPTLTSAIVSSSSQVPTGSSYSCNDLDIMLVIDRSSTMQNEHEADGRNKLSWAKDAAAGFVQAIKDTGTSSIRVGVASFGAQGNDGTGSLGSDYNSALNIGLTGDYNSVISAINNIAYIRSGTCIECGLKIGNNQFSDSGNRRVEILLSDGKANHNWDGSTSNSKARAINVANDGRSNGIEYRVLGYGLESSGDIDENTLLQIAGSPAYYQYKPNVADWSEAFLDILEELCSDGDITEELLVCEDSSVIESGPRYVYLTFDNLVGEIFTNPVENTEDLRDMQFEVTYRNYQQSLSVQWYDGDSWEPVCGPFASTEKTTQICSLPQGFLDRVIQGDIDESQPILRLVIV